MATSSSSLNTVKGRVIYVLAAMLFLQLTYPFSLQGDTQNLLYFGAYCLLLASGVYVAATNRWHLFFAVGTALLTLGFGIPWVLSEGSITWLTLSNYTALATFQSTIIFILLAFIFSSDEVTRDVLYAATTVYILFGNTFTALFMIIQTLQPDAFRTSELETPIAWPYMVYYSYSTLTTLGYGDIVPRSAWAQSLAAVEAMLGLLYIAIIIGRLASFYQAGDEKKD